MKLNLLVNKYPVISGIFALLAIISVLVMEHGFDLRPCKLCLMQRTPYYLIIVLSAAYFLFERGFLVYFIILSFFSGAVISFYHAGIEYGVFTNILTCDQLLSFDNGKELLLSLKDKISTPCEKPAFKFIFSLSGWNFLFSFLFGVLGIIFLKRVK
jgi:disulfide bond formation protein DsbB